MKISQIEELIEDKINSLGYILYDIEKSKESNGIVLRVIIDKKDGITIEDCEKVTNEIDPIIFDQKNQNEDIDFFEVSSAGVEKQLKNDKHLKENLDQEVEVKLYSKIEINNDMKKEVSGILKSFDDKNVYIEVSGTKIPIEKNSISSIKTIYDFSRDFGGINESNR